MLYERALAFGEQAARHPSWAVGHIANLLARYRSEDVVGENPKPVGPLDALAWLFPDRTDARDVVAALPRPPMVDVAGRAASPALATLCYAIVRLGQPQAVCEVGVAEGVTSFYLLSGLAACGQGVLTSVDLPGLFFAWKTETGRVVPPELRSRWRLLLGPSQFALPRALRNCHPLGLAVHDGSHHPATQSQEYGILWRHLQPGGILLSDDVGNGAMSTFARGIGAEMLTVRRREDSGVLGVMRKRVA
jgi:hypothetical protein